MIWERRKPRLTRRARFGALLALFLTLALFAPGLSVPTDAPSRRAAQGKTETPAPQAPDAQSVIEGAAPTAQTEASQTVEATDAQAAEAQTPTASAQTTDAEAPQTVEGNAQAVAEAFPADAEGIPTPDNPSGRLPPRPAEQAAPRSKAETLLEGMSLREKVFQLFVVFPEQLTGKAPVTAAGDAVRQGLERYPVGGVIFDRDSMKSKAQVRALLDDMQSMSRIPLLMTCDEEGGRVNRLMGAVGTPYVGAMLSYRDGGAETAKANALKIAGGLTSCGFNMDLAPVADVWSNPDNKVIGNRAYSTDFQEAAELIPAAVAGFHEGGVACTLKHFPGHGNTYEDSHNGLAKVYRTREQLENGELKPFRVGIAAGADAVMVGHLVAGEIDAEPATMSRVIVTDILRGELGFAGVVMTDSLQMDAISKNYTPGEAALGALEAGIDILLCPDDLGWAAEAVLYAVETGRLTEARIDESVLRVLNLKEAYGLLD